MPFDFVGSECRYLVLLDTPVVASGRNLRKIPEIGCVDLSKTAYVASVGDKLLGEYMGDDSWNYFYLDDKDDVCQGVGGSSGTGFSFLQMVR